MGKLVTILGGCVIAAAGVTYGVYNHYEGGCGRHAAGCAKEVVVTDCCADSSESCPLSAGAAVSAEGSCPLSAAGASCCESAKAAKLVKAEVNCCDDAAGCDSGLAAVAGAAAFAGKK